MSIPIPPTNIDITIITWINQFHYPFLDRLMVFVANIGEYAIIWLAIGLFILLTNKKKGKKIFTLLVLALIIEVIINDGIIKQLFFRERPYIFLSNIYHLGPDWTNGSFISGHTASTVAAIAVTGCFYHKWLFWLIPFGLLMIYTRLYLGMHYPTDIIGAVIIGLISTSLSFKIIKKVLR